MHVASIEKNFFKNQGQKQELMLKIEDQQYELDYLKEVNKKLINQLLQSRLNTQVALKQIQKEADEATGNIGSPLARRRTTIRKQITKRGSPTPFSEYNILEYASQQQLEIYQGIANQIEDLQELLSNLSQESGKTIKKLQGKVKKYKEKYQDMIRMKNLIQKQQQAEAVRNKKLNEQILSMRFDAKKLQNLLDHYILQSSDQQEKIQDQKINLDRYRNQIMQYQRKYQDIDLDALHEQIQLLQTKNISFQSKINHLTHQVQDLEKRGGSALFRQNNIYDKLLGKNADRLEHNLDDDDDDNNSTDNAQVFLQNADDNQDPEKMSPNQRAQFENGKLLLQKALAKKGINLDYEVKLNNKVAREFELKIV
eukprot:403339048